ncbi:winged helix-turn-helix transcriptional regulator [Deinococcus multiflagellatus]|uniref:Winged helix-turn-helix transcriptional regulator n=1 Tax=Deinococcus multiflagellatus TaxID=1656887 RepID=A0ABW1ZM01_9DEIO|nr:helix-turn-helix domain-containing protein [Deinococcus multiflagellatus]MBZ9714854.1 helix-turn-helix transcriptional regulator [Deinococcus multiflagellatus]
MKYGHAVVSRPECGVERTMQVIGGKWTTLILRDLLGGRRRFSDLKRTLGRVSPKTLTERLRQLEAQGLVTRTVYAEVPPRVEYALTEQGQSLSEIIAAMARWGSRWTPPGGPGDTGDQPVSAAP